MVYNAHSQIHVIQWCICIYFNQKKVSLFIVLNSWTHQTLIPNSALCRLLAVYRNGTRNTGKRSCPGWLRISEPHRLCQFCTNSGLKSLNFSRAAFVAWPALAADWLDFLFKKGNNNLQCLQRLAYLQISSIRRIIDGGLVIWHCHDF